MQARSVLVRGARQLLTLSGPDGLRRGSDLREIGIIRDGSVLIRDGKIVRVGTTRSVENLAEARDAEEIDATGRVVMPAFVDCRAELLRPSEPGDPANQPQRLMAAARRTLEGCLRHGTGTIEVRCGSGEDEAADLRLLRSAGRLDTAIGVVRAYGTPAQRDPAANWVGTSLLPGIERKALARYASMFCGNGTSTPDETRRYAEFCRRHGLEIKIEVAPGREALKAALECNPATIEAVSTLQDDEAREVAASDAVAVLIPTRALGRSAGSSAPGRQLIDAGVAVAVASGFRYGESGTFNMQMVVTLAVTRLQMTPEEAITAATINAAYASGVGGRTGSLQHAKDADLIVLNVSDYHEMFRQIGANLVETVVRQGRVVYREARVR